MKCFSKSLAAITMVLATSFFNAQFVKALSPVVIEVPVRVPDDGATNYSADLSGCGINRDCMSCARNYGCQWNSVSGCTAGFGATVCPIVPDEGAVKPTCSAYTDCKSCTTQAGCVFYKGQCTYSRGSGCQNDPWNCVNYPSQCPDSTPPPQCQSVYDCPNFQTCDFNTNQCVCYSDHACASGKFCNLNNGMCESYCYGHHECSRGQYCDLDFKCKSLPAPQPRITYCESVYHCRSIPNQTCNFNTNECVTDPYNKLGQELCFSDDDCMSGKFCNLTKGLCESYCHDHYQCGNGQYCDFVDLKCKYP